MPDLSSNLTALRADGHSVRAYLAVLGGVVVASGTLNSVPATGAVALAWTRTAGSSAAIKAGYRVTVEDASGNLKLETSVRYSGTISDSSLPIREIASAEFTLSAADKVKIFNTPVLTDKLVEANATFAPDGIAYSAQNTTISPIACSGGLWVGFVDAGQTYATVATDGSGSFTVDPDSAGTVTHLWTLPSGVAFQAGSANTDASPTLEADAGYALVTHTVTDSSNSATWTQYLLLRVYSAVDMPTECVIEQINGDLDVGWSGTIRLFDGASLAAIPDRSLVAVFVQETINGAQASYGNRIPSRSHIKLTGYLVRETAEGDGGNDALTVEIMSPWARLQEIPGFSKVLERYTSTTGWRYLQGLTVKRALLQILRWYSNWTEFWDVGFDAFTDYNYPALNLEKATPLGQLIELADAADGRVTGDRTGAMRVHTRPELVALASRSSLTTTLTLTDDDRINYRFSREHFRQVEQLECRGFTAATTTAGATPIFSRYPGVPGRGVLNTAIEKLIATSQTDLNNRCGLRGAALDGVFITAAGLYHRAVELELTLPGAYDVFDPAYQEWIAFTGAAGNRRALDLSAFRFVLRSVNVTYANGTAQSNLRLVSETAAPAGKTYVPPATIGGNPDINLDFPPITFPDIGTGGFWLNAGSGGIALICENGLARTSNFGSGAATVWDYKPWYGVSGFQNVAARQGYTAVPDAFSYVSGPVKAWVLFSTDGAVWEVDIANRTYTSLGAPLGGISFQPGLGGANSNGGMSIDASFAEPGVIAMVRVRGFTQTTLAHSEDSGANWSVVNFSGASSSRRGAGGIWVSSRTPGKLVVGGSDGGNWFWGGEFGYVYKSANYGATLATIGGGSLTAPFNPSSIGSPYDAARNAAEDILFYSSSVYSSRDRFYRSNGTSQTDISPTVSGEYYACMAPRNGWSTAINNANRLLLAATKPDGTVRKLFLTNNALAATPSWTELTGTGGAAYGCCAISGDNPNVFYLWGGMSGGVGGVDTSTVALSIDGGTTIVSQVGNLASFTPGEVRMLVGW